MINICSCLRLKSKQISILSQKGGYGSSGVIGYTDSEYDIVNNMWCICVVKKVIPQIAEVTFPQPRAEGPSADTKCPQLA